MATDKMYELGYAYRKTRLWQRVGRERLFAFPCDDGQKGYVALSDDPEGLFVYVGEEAVQGYLRTISHDLSDLDFDSQLLDFDDQSEDSYLCMFVQADSLDSAERLEVERYAQAHKLALKGRNSYVYFLRHRPYYVNEPIIGRWDQTILCQALQAVLDLSKLLGARHPDQLHLYAFQDHPATIPLIESIDGQPVLRDIPYPKTVSLSYPQPVCPVGSYLLELQRRARMYTLECIDFTSLEPVQSRPNGPAFFPVALLMRPSNTQWATRTNLCPYDLNSGDLLLQEFVRMVMQWPFCPERIIVGDQLCYALLQDFCEKLAIRLLLYPGSKSIQAMKKAMIQDMIGPLFMALG